MSPLGEQLLLWFQANQSRLRGTKKEAEEAWKAIRASELYNPEAIEQSLAGALSTDKDTEQRWVSRNLKRYTVELTGVLNQSKEQLSDLVRRVAKAPHNLSQIASEVARITETTEKKAATVANTITAQAQRELVMQAAASSPSREETVFVYQGSEDELTRPFCAALVNLALTEGQIDRLDNGQGLPVKTSGGGWNCRHSWSPMPASAADAAGYRRATESDIAAANAAAKERRR